MLVLADGTPGTGFASRFRPLYIMFFFLLGDLFRVEGSVSRRYAIDGDEIRSVIGTYRWREGYRLLYRVEKIA